MFEKITERIIRVLLLISLGALIYVNVLQSNTYERQGIISSINSEDEATIVDTTGNIWAYESSALSQGQVVILEMNDNETKEVFDDIITKVTIIGI